MEKLKPCPFCGGQVKVEKLDIAHSERWEILHPLGGKCILSYGHPDNMFSYFKKEAAIKAWNTRTTNL